MEVGPFSPATLTVNAVSVLLESLSGALSSFPPEQEESEIIRIAAIRNTPRRIDKYLAGFSFFIGILTFPQRPPGGGIAPPFLPLPVWNFNARGNFYPRRFILPLFLQYFCCICNKHKNNTLKAYFKGFWFLKTNPEIFNCLNKLVSLTIKSNRHIMSYKITERPVNLFLL